MPVFLPQSLAKASNQVSYWGTKWLPSMIFSVLVCASAVATNGADIAGVRPAAPAAAPARFRKPRRVMMELNLFPPDRIGCLLRSRLKVVALSARKLQLSTRERLGDEGVGPGHLRDMFLAGATLAPDGCRLCVGRRSGA